MAQREALMWFFIAQLVSALIRLPKDKIKEVPDYADYLSNKFDDEVLQKELKRL
jgi:hypothetical protein